MVPDIDDGSTSLAESIAMAKTAMLDGTTSLIATPHQLGTNSHVSAEAIVNGVNKLQSALKQGDIPV